jgi:hypothetical protein
MARYLLIPSRQFRRRCSVILSETSSASPQSGVFRCDALLDVCPIRPVRRSRLRFQMSNKGLQNLVTSTKLHYIKSLTESDISSVKIRDLTKYSGRWERSNYCKENKHRETRALRPFSECTTAERRISRMTYPRPKRNRVRSISVKLPRTAPANRSRTYTVRTREVL